MDCAFESIRFMFIFHLISNFIVSRFFSLSLSLNFGCFLSVYMLLALRTIDSSVFVSLCQQLCLHSTFSLKKKGSILFLKVGQSQRECVFSSIFVFSRIWNICHENSKMKNLIRELCTLKMY